MSNHRRWVVGRRHLLVITAAVVGTSYASWLQLWSERAQTDACAGAAGLSSSACVDLEATPELAVDDERVHIPLGGLPHKGASGPAAKVTMIECSDFECPFSKRASGTVDELLAHNDDLAFHHVHFPLGMFEHSELKARAGVAAQRQGKFWPMHDGLFAAQVESEHDAIALAQRIGLDVERFTADLRKHEVRAEVERQRGLCKAAGVRAVPTFFINGRRVVGALPTKDFQRVIDEERR
jgi:protein-disulfide isomerase